MCVCVCLSVYVCVRWCGGGPRALAVRTCARTLKVEKSVKVVASSHAQFLGNALS